VVNAGNSLIDFTIDTVAVTVEITGALNQTMTVLLNDNSRNNGDPLPIGGYADVSFAPVNMTASGTYNFLVYTSLPADGDQTNDTLALVSIIVSAPQVTITGNSSACAAAPTVLTANASGGDGNYSYQWSAGLGTNSSVTVTPSQNTVYYVSITDGCGYFSNDSFALQVLPDPTAMFTYNVTNNSVSFTDNSQNTTGWSWDFGDTQSSTQQNPTHTYTTNGTYTVILTASNGCGTDTSTAVISIITTGISPVEGNSVMTIFPNPASQSFTIYFPQAEGDLVLELTDVDGKLLERKEIGNTMGGMSFVMDISGFESGIYFLRVSSSRLSEVQKVVIEH
jgi:hypothetical protein